MTKKLKINDVINIKGIPQTNSNHEGKITKITSKGVYITNINMPFMGTYIDKFVPNEKIIEIKR